MTGTHLRFRQRGMTLVEVLIATTIAIFLIGGAMAVYLTASSSRNVNDDVARMQENARYAMSVIKPDLRLAGFWGRTRLVGLLTGYAGSTTPLSGITGDCAALWYIDLARVVDASDDVNPYSATCLDDDEYLDGTDVLVVRHAADTQATGALVNGQVYIRSDANQGTVFVAPAVPAGSFSTFAETRALETHAYYIRPYSFVVGDGIPSLRRLVLGVNANSPAILSEDIIPGIEDLQVQFGLDTDEDGSINQYVNPDSAAIAGANVLAVRVWVMARVMEPETGFRNDATYTYASKSVTPADGFRRLLISSTVQLRNMQVNGL